MLGLPQKIPACRSPYGERGLKFLERLGEFRFEGRSPYGERGLKSFNCRV